MITKTSLDEIEKNGDSTYIFNGYERNAFPFCPYEEERIDLINENNKWLVRTNAEYHRTALWCSCRFLKEYIDSFGENNIKRKAALIIKRDNWSKTIKQYIDEKLEKADYWTFADCKKQDDENRILGKQVKYRKYPKIQHQFVHDLWTDYTLYLRKWIAYIEMFPRDEDDWGEMINIGDMDMKPMYKNEHKKNKKRIKKEIDPTVIPDYPFFDSVVGLKLKCKLD